MTQVQWQNLESVVAEMTPEEKLRLAALLVAPAPVDECGNDPLLGAMSDEPELLDRVMENVYRHRESRTWRVRD